MDGFRLSPQQSLLDHAALGDAGDQLWSQQIVLDLSGDELDEHELKQALAAVLASHEIFSTYFARLAGVRVQAIAGGLHDDYWRSVDLRDQSSGAQADSISDYRKEQSVAIPSEGSSPVKATYFRLTDDAASLLIATSPMIADSSTLVALANETLLRIAEQASDVQSAEEALEYADISEWLNEILDGEEGASDREVWSRLLDTESDPPPLSRRGQTLERYAFESVEMSLDGSVCKDVESLATAVGVSKETVLSAAWLALLARLAEDGVVVCGRVSDGRTYDELTDSLGPLEKSLPMLAETGNGLGLREFASLVNERILDADGRQEHFGAINQPDTKSYGDHWNLVCHVFNASLVSPKGGLTARLRDVAAHDAPFRQKLTVMLTNGEIRAALWFDPKLSDRRESESLLERWSSFLKHALGAPSTALSDLSILLDNDREAIGLNERFSELHASDNASLFSVLRNLDKQDHSSPAVSAGDSTWTYGELSEWSNRVANRVLKDYSGNDTPVGVCIGRRPELIAAIVGVLNAGKTYVPIDPTYPAARISQVLEDSGAELLLTTSDMALNLPTGDYEQIQVQRDSRELLDSPTSLPTVEIDDESTAYILYTSGSTGMPKGVAVSRRNLAHSTAARLTYYDETPEAFLLLSSIAFDSSVAGLYWTLLGGGHLLLLETAQGLDINEIARVCRRHRPSHTLCLPSVYRLMLDEISDDDMQSLRCVVVAGESCSAGVVREHFKKSPDRKLVNEYGPTEGTVWCVAHTFSATDELSTGVPIGTAIPGYSIRLLDKNQQRVPIGSKGEIYISGDGVATGYWNQPTLTAERFIDLSDESDTALRSYRTGDIGRLRPSGEIDFLGRRDNQIKINGYRIELEEVESTVKLSTGVIDAAVIVREDSGSQARIVAFVTAESGTTADILARQLGERLPSYMVPSEFQIIAELPRTPNGKIDRNELSEMPLGDDQDAAFVAPRNEVEQLVLDVWCELLERDTIGIEDDFFKSGGHSILATRLAARLREFLQVPVPIRTIFENPTVAALVKALREDPQNATQLDAVEETLAAQ